MPPGTPPPLQLPLLAPLLVPLLAPLLLQGCWCAVEQHAAAGQHRSGLLPLTPLLTVPAGAAMASRAQCLARCARHPDCISFNFGQLSSDVSGCQLLGGALCEAGGAFNELQRQADVNYYDLYRAAAVGEAEINQHALWTECQTTGRCAVPRCQPVLGDYCTSSSVCQAYISNAECSDSSCQCPSDHWVNSNTDCQPGVALGGACTSNIECQTITPGSECSSSGTCACPAGTWNNQNAECLPVKALGESCSVDPECGDEATTHCPSGECTCRPSHGVINGACRPGKALGEACSVTEECTIITANALCTSSVCSCPSGHWDNAGTCRASVPYGGSCSYSQDCSTHDSRFSCYNGVCSDFVCSSVTVGGYEYRLAGGSSACNQGRVELRQAGSGTWGQVCDDGWDAMDAAVLCKSLGFTSGTGTCCSSHWYATGANFYMDDVACSGSESHLLQCGYGGWGVENCGDGEVSSVTCS